MNTTLVRVSSASSVSTLAHIDAITFDQVFEHAVFDRTKLVLQLNREGSKVIEKKKNKRIWDLHLKQ